MAINPENEYPGRIEPSSADYPYGAARDESIEGAEDGTPVQVNWLKDLQGFFQALLTRAAIVPSGDPDTVQASDYMDALTGEGTPILPLGALTNGTADIDAGTKNLLIRCSGSDCDVRVSDGEIIAELAAGTVSLRDNDEEVLIDKLGIQTNPVTEALATSRYQHNLMQHTTLQPGFAGWRTTTVTPASVALSGSTGDAQRSISVLYNKIAFRTAAGTWAERFEVDVDCSALAAFSQVGSTKEYTYASLNTGLPSPIKVISVSATWYESGVYYCVPCYAEAYNSGGDTLINLMCYSSTRPWNTGTTIRKLRIVYEP